MGKFTIYCMVEETKTPTIAYIGRTGNDLSVRYKQHCNDAFNKSGANQSEKAVFIRDVYNRGGSVVIFQLDSTEDYLRSHELEAYWVQQFKIWGYKLLNKDKSLPNSMTAGCAIYKIKQDGFSDDLQNQIIEHLSDGMSAKEITALMNLSKGVVSKYIDIMKGIYGAKNVVHLVVIYLKLKK